MQSFSSHSFFKRNYKFNRPAACLKGNNREYEAKSENEYNIRLASLIRLHQAPNIPKIIQKSDPGCSMVWGIGFGLEILGETGMFHRVYCKISHGISHGISRAGFQLNPRTGCYYFIKKSFFAEIIRLVGSNHKPPCAK